MLRKVMYAALERKLKRAYIDRFAALGPTTKGVFWRNQSTQIARFDALLDLVTTVTPAANPSIAEIGCGSGAMFEFLQKIIIFQQLSSNFASILMKISRNFAEDSRIIK